MIQSIFGASPIEGMQSAEIKQAPTSSEVQQSFGSFLKTAIEDTNDLQVQSDVMTQKLIMGENVELHEVMIAAQKAAISLNATMEVRNKVVEAYQEIIRMPV